MAAIGLFVQLGAGCDGGCKPQPAPAILQAPQLTDAQIIDRFHRIVYHSMAWSKMTWLGIEALQNPNDVWAYQQIFFETKPDFVVETGTHHGGGALVWATLMSAINPAAKVLTIDIEDKSGEARKLPLFKEKIEHVMGSSTSDAVFQTIRKRVQGKKVTVILDSNHARSHVLDELMLYGDLVPVGGYLLVQDTNVNGHPALPTHGPGPWEAVADFMKAGGKSNGGATFEVDTTRELLFFTMHPRGFLKRVR